MIEDIFIEVIRKVREAFERYHALNPHVYEIFKKFALQMAAKTSQGSAYEIIQHMRWQAKFETTDDSYVVHKENGETTKFKISNNYTPLYARLFARDFPQHKDLFVFHKLKTDMA